jgi:predicted RNase H-like nuclease (RuvC/YqgF family)
MQRPLGAAEEEEPIPTLREPMTRRDARDERRRAIEELIEGIVEEKWNALSGEIDQIKSQFMDLQSKLNRLEQSLNNKETSRTKNYDEIDGKIDSYKQSMSDISSRMGAVENAMKNTMTPMMQTMRSLTDAVKSLKEGSEQEEPRPKSRKPARDGDKYEFSPDDDEDPEDGLSK